MRQLLLFLIFLITAQAFAGTYDFNNNCKEALRNIYQLRLIEARHRISQEDPGNMAALYLEHYAEAVELLVSEDINKFEQFQDNYDKRIDVLNSHSAKSPYFKYIKAELKFHYGLAHLKFGSKMTGIRLLFSSNSLAKEISKDYPDFPHSKKLIGIYKIIFDHVPPVFKWATNLMGMKGDLLTGIEDLKAYSKEVEGQNGFDVESQFFIGMAYKFIMDYEQGYQYYESIGSVKEDVAVLNYFYINLAYRSAHNEEALAAIRKFNWTLVQTDLHILDYMLGKVLLNKGEKSAVTYLEKYYKQSLGQDYKKDIANRIAKYYRLFDDDSSYEYYREQVKKVGRNLTDQDQLAIVQSKHNWVYNKKFLQIQLLLSGGYVKEADELLRALPFNAFVKKPYKNYRDYLKGMILLKQDKPEQAVSYFTKIIEDKNNDVPFAADAAYQIGFVKESLSEYQQALDYYNIALELNNSDFDFYYGPKIKVAKKRVQKKV